MPTATYAGVIQAPPEEVFAFVADAENNPSWHEHVRETHWIDEGPTRLGRRGRQRSRLWGETGSSWPRSLSVGILPVTSPFR
jgi:uncharacterized protein YndB with AHSA1/START domain